MQLIKIIIKNYKHKSNLSSYIIYYTCLTISTAMFFITFTFLSSISMFSNMANAYDNVSGMFIIYTSFMIVVEVIFMNYAFNYYLARQKKNYGILIALGISNKKLIMWILTEQLITFIISFLSGILIGNIFVGVLKIFLAGIGYKILLTLNHTVYFLTFGVSFTVLLVSMLFCSIYLRKKRVSKVLRNRNKTNKYATLFFTVLGLVLIIYSIVRMKHYDVLTMIISLILCVVGICLLICFGCDLAIRIIYKFEKFYYKRMLPIQNFHYKLNENKKIMCILFIINFMIIYIISGFIISSIFVLQEDYYVEYPYDIVYVSEEKNNLERDYSIDNYKRIDINCFIYNNRYNNSNAICINNRDYARLTNENEDVKDNKIIYLSQRNEPDSNLPYPEEYFKIENRGMAKDYKVKKAINKIIFGERLSETLEKVIVLNDKEFEKYKTMEHKVISLYKIQENTSQDFNKLVFIQKEVNKSNNAEIYIKNLLIQMQNYEHMLILIVFLCIGLFSIICCLCIFCIKLFSMNEELIEEGKLYSSLGMTKQFMKKTFNAECNYIFIIPVCLSITFATIFFGFNFINQVDVDKRVLLYYFIVLIFYIGIEMIYYITFKNKNIKKVLKKIINK